MNPVILCDKGAIILKMGKALRVGEEMAFDDYLQSLGIPIHYRLHGNACAEGGDLLWVDEKNFSRWTGVFEQTKQESSNCVRLCQISR